MGALAPHRALTCSANFGESDDSAPASPPTMLSALALVLSYSAPEAPAKVTDVVWVGHTW